MQHASQSAAPSQGSRAVEEIAEEALALLGAGRQVLPFSQRYAGFDLAQAYAVAARVRETRRQRGERPIGRKIGFTNAAAWGKDAVHGPISNFVFDTTVLDGPAGSAILALTGLPQPRIEPEIVLHLACAPERGMGTEQLYGCVDWVAHGIEIVHSIFPDWRFAAADALAAFGLHGALLIGERHPLRSLAPGGPDALAGFTIELARADGLVRRGHGRDVLGGPLAALRFLVDEMARWPAAESLVAGELVTTGSLTEAMPIAPGERWSTRIVGVALQGLEVVLR